MKIALSVLITAASALALVGCASPGNSAGCTPLSTSGDATKKVSVTGNFGSKPTVTFDAGLSATETQSEALSTGAGDVVLPGQSISIDAQLYDGATGKLINETAFDGTGRPTIPVNIEVLGGITKALQCQHVGSRVLAVIGGDETLATNMGLDKTGTIVAVFDIVSANLQKANGEPQVVPDGLPRVVLADDGTPGITIPNTAAPTALSVTLLKKGTGAVVAAHANVTVHYTGVVWGGTGEAFDSSWTKGTPADFNVDGVIPGFRDALVGQAVGSQILVIIPPDQGYGSQATGNIPANSTLVFVIDILGTSL